MERARYNMPHVPFTTYECGKLHRQTNATKLLNVLKAYQQSHQGRYINKLIMKQNLVISPQMRMLQYLLATRNLGTKLNPHYTDYDMSCLSSWQKPEKFMTLLFNSLTNNPFEKVADPFTNYGASLNRPTKDHLEKKKDFLQFAKRVSKLYNRIAGDYEHLHTRNIATQTAIRQDDILGKEKTVKEAYPFLSPSVSDESMQVKPYDFTERTERGRSLFKVYYHTPFDSQNPRDNIMGVVHNDDFQMPSSWLDNKMKRNESQRRRSSTERKSISVWQSPLVFDVIA